ncbi:MAG: FAD-binding oxidoreductase, partial [Rhodovibrionaceae bacterium]|nr:FAD-binding oxidoreductase [Rhodovibrionaceae bacterium]
GGGYTGLSAALELAGKGRDVVLLEANGVGWGCSGRNGGQISADMKCGLGPAERNLGKDDARKIYEMTRAAVRLIDERAARYGMEIERCHGHFTAATKASALRALEAEQRHMAEVYGMTHLELVKGEAVREHVDSPRYVGGLADPEGGHIHPLKYALGLACAAEGAGARIHEATPALEVRSGEAGRPARVRTKMGTVTAEAVLVAANGYLGDLVPSMARGIMPVGSYIAATRPLGEERARALIGRNEAIVDTNRILHYYRMSSDHRLLFGGRLATSLWRQPDLPRAMRAMVARVFPQLDDVGFDYLWSGDVAVTMNRAPQLGRLDGGIYYAQGYSGHGAALSGFFGKLAAEAIAGESEGFDLFGRLPAHDFPGGAGLRRPLFAAALLWCRLRDILP